MNARSVLLGLLVTALISALAPYNDLLVANTFLIGGTMPIGLLVFFLLLVVLINAPFHRLWPGQAFHGGELGVALAIGLVGCAVPAVGFHNYVMGSIVGLWHIAGQDVLVARLLSDLQLPAWLFPIADTSNPTAAALDPTITGFMSRVPPGEGGVPWSAWLMPAIAWALWLGCMGLTIICLSLIVRRQWVENERLAFPVATVYTTLLEDPQPGNALNGLLLSRLFWVIFATVFFLRGFDSLAAYFPQQVPALSLGFDLRSLATQPPLSNADIFLKVQSVYFAVIGITFLLQTRIAFSLWFMYVLFQCAVMLAAAGGAEFTQPMQQDHTAGALLVMVGLVIWVGRAHWLLVLRQMIGRRRAEDPVDPYLPMWLAGWGAALGAAGMVMFLVFAGASLAGALVAVLLLLLIVMMVARIAAETGLYYIQINMPLQRVWAYLAATPLGIRTTAGSFFFTAFLNASFTHDTRETLSVYATHALKVNDQMAPPRRWQGVWFVIGMFMALAVAYLIGGASMLRMEYANAATLASPPTAPVNRYGAEVLPRELIARPTIAYEQGQSTQTHSHLLHASIGAGATGLLGILRFRLSLWPIHPLGYLLAFSYPIARMWFSIFLGWLAKAAAVKYGGAGLLKWLRDAAIGMIVGEAAAVGFWLIIAVLLAAGGYEYRVMYLTP